MLIIAVLRGDCLRCMGLTWLLTLTKCHVCTPDVLRQVVYSYLFGIIFFSEHLSLFGVLGTLLIAAGMALVTARSATIQPSEKTDTARSIAAAGIGSKIFQRSISNSSLRTCQSYQRLIGVENHPLLHQQKQSFQVLPVVARLYLRGPGMEVSA